MGQNDIQRGGLNSILRRTLNVKGDLPPAPVVGAEIIPTLPLEVDRPEWGYLNEERRGIVEMNPPAVAGKTGVAMLEVPTITDLLVVVTAITVQMPPGGVTRHFNLHIAGPTQGIGSLMDGPAQVAGTANDTRYASSINAAVGFCTVRGQQGARAGFTGTFLVDLICPATEHADFCARTGPFILGPGYKLLVWNSQSNELFCCCYRFYERTLQPNEKPVGQTGLL